MASFVEDPSVQAEIDALFDAKYEGYRLPVAAPEATRRHYAAPRAYIDVRLAGPP